MSYLTSLYAWMMANKIALLLAASQFCTTLQMHIPASEMPAWLKLVLKWAGYIAPEGTKGLVGRFSVPYLHVPRAVKSAAPVAPAVALLLVTLLGLGACSYCQKGSSKNTVECKAYRSLVQCGPKTLAILAGDLGLIASGDWPQVLADVLQQAPEEYVCFSAAVADALTKKYGKNSVEMSKFLDADQVARAKAKK